MGIQLKEGKQWHSPYNDYIATAVGKIQDVDVKRSIREAIVYVDIYENVNAMNNGRLPLTTLPLVASGDWYTTYFASPVEGELKPASLVAKAGYLFLHAYKESIWDDTTQDYVDYYPWGDWEPDF